MSRFNLSWTKFLKLTPIEFFLALQDQEEFEISKIKPVCESIRTSTWYLLNVQVKKRIKKPQNLFSLPWDIISGSEKEPQTLQEMKNVMRSIVSSTKNRKKTKK